MRAHAAAQEQYRRHAYAAAHEYVIALVVVPVEAVAHAAGQLYVVAHVQAAELARALALLLYRQYQIVAQHVAHAYRAREYAG